MFRRATLLLAVFCLFAVSCSGSADELPGVGDGDTVTDTTVDAPVEASDDADVAGCALSQAQAIERARGFAEADDMGDIADDFLSAGGVVEEANVREDFWEVTFTSEGGAIEIYLTCEGALASIGTNGDAQP